MTKGYTKLKAGCYVARINRGGKRIHLGTFKTAEAASKAYHAALDTFGANPGKPGRRPQVSIADLYNLYEFHRERIDEQDETIRQLDRKVRFLNKLVRALQDRVR